MRRGWQSLLPAERQTFVVFALGYLALFLWSRNLPFFADGVVQSSMAGQYFADKGLSVFFLPEAQNPGHPPFWGIYLGAWFLLFGKHLWVAHLACLPFLWIALWQFLWIGKRWVAPESLWVLLLFFFLEPTWLAQATQVLPDLALTAFFLLALRGLLDGRTFLLILGCCLMPLLNTRGIMLVAVIGICEAGLYWIEGGKGIPWKRALKYFAPLAVILSWLSLHYLHSGWVGFNREEMPWRESFVKVDFSGWLRNLAVLVWRFLDFGRLMVWIPILLLLFFRNGRVLLFSGKGRALVWITMIPTLVFLPVITAYTGTMQHRYLLPGFILSLVLLCYLMDHHPLKKFRKVLIPLIIVSFISGHFWVYPDKISQGWDASLAHISYFELRQSMIKFLEEMNVSPDSVATGTPNKYKLIHTDLKEADWKFVDHTEVDVHNYPYVLYLNLSNDFDGIYDELHNTWYLEKEWKKRGIVLRLFHNPAFSDE